MKDLVLHLLAFLGNYVTNVQQPRPPPTPSDPGEGTAGAVAHALNKNVCPIKRRRGTLVPGAAVPLVPWKINKSPRNAQRTRGELYISDNTR